MNTKVTVIADKDIGPVLGAVTEVNAKDKLGIDQVVGEIGFPMRNGVQVALQVPAIQLDTFLAAGEGALTDPRSYVVINGVPTAVPDARKIDGVSFVSNSIKITFGPNPPSINSDIKVKAITRRRSDNVIEVFGPATVRPAPDITVGASLRQGESYDVLVLVEGYRSFLTEDVLAA